MQLIYVMWCGDTPDKGIATDDLTSFGEARATLRQSGIDFRYALIPVMAADEIMPAVTQLIKENSK